jgi:hypothetical protein
MGVQRRNPVGICLGSIMRYFPRDLIESILEETGRQSVRRRKLPAPEMMYYVIALGLFFSDGCREVLRRVLRRTRAVWPEEYDDVSTESAISQARTRLGSKPVEQLYHAVARPIATRQTIDAWYRRWRLVTIDGTILDVADTPKNERAFHRPGVSFGSAAYPQLRIVTLLENGTHVLFGAAIGGYQCGEKTLAAKIVERLPADALCLADRGLFGYPLWCAARRTGAELLWRVQSNLVLPRLRELSDRSYLSKIYPSPNHRRDDREGVWVRVISFDVGPRRRNPEHYLLLCSILDPKKAPAIQLANLYARRWTVETTFAELKTRLRGPALVIRSKTPEHVRQDVFGMLLAHFGVRALMHEAALAQRCEPGDLSFVQALRIVHAHLPEIVSFPPSVHLIGPPPDPLGDRTLQNPLSSSQALPSRA